MLRLLTYFLVDVDMSIMKSWTVVLVNLLIIKMRELSPRKLKDISLNFQDFSVKLSCRSFI